MNDYLSNIKDFVLNEEKEGLNLDDVIEHGCVSGIVGSLIYYSDTVKFYDSHQDEIWDLLEEQSQCYGYDNVLAFMASFNGAEHVGDLDQFKNLLAWWSVEETIRTLLNERDDVLHTEQEVQHA